MVDVIDLKSVAARRPDSSPGSLTDEDLIRAIEDLALVYEYNGRHPDEDDCLRLTINQARQIAAIARHGLTVQRAAVATATTNQISKIPAFTAELIDIKVVDRKD